MRLHLFLPRAVKETSFNLTIERAFYIVRSFYEECHQSFVITGREPTGPVQKFLASRWTALRQKAWKA